MIILATLTTSLIHFSLKGWGNVLFECIFIPVSIPVSGACFRFGSHVHEDLMKMAKKYGDVFSLKLGSRQVVVLNGSDAIREALVHNAVTFAGRPDFHSFKVGSESGQGISLSDYNAQLRLVKKLALGAIHKFVHRNGDVLDGKLTKECQRLVKDLREKQRIPLDPTMPLKSATANVILGALFGFDRDYDNEELREILGIAHLFGETIGSGSAVDIMPWLRFFPNPPLRKLRELIARVQSLMGRLYLANKAYCSPGKIRNVADSFAKVMDEERVMLTGVDSNNNNNNNNNYCDDNNNNNEGCMTYADLEDNNSGDNHDEDLNNNNNTTAPVDTTKPLVSDSDVARALADLFGAGFETTATSIRWALAYLVKHPNIQGALQRELDDVIGRERLPTSRDMGQLPLLEATVYELLRMTSVTPLALPHATLEDTRLAGYEIPKGTTVFVNLWSLHRSARYWDEPDVFNPYRFIDERGRTRDPKSLPGFLPFGSGRRQCPGRALAIIEIFTILGALLHQFRFSQEELDTQLQGINFRGKVGLVLTPETFYVHMQAR